MWLLLLALPLQGYAAALMLHCGPSHHGMMDQLVSVPTELHHHSVEGGAHHAIDIAADQGTVAVIDAGGEDGSVHHLTTLSKFKCSACASCCVGAALPATALVFASSEPAHTPTRFVLASPVGFFTDGPDRPPRLVLA